MVNVRRVVAAKAETVYGTDSIPTLAADAVMTRNYAIVPLEVDQLQRNFDSRTYLPRAAVWLLPRSHAQSGGRSQAGH